MKPGAFLYNTLNAQVFDGTENKDKASAFQQAVANVQHLGWDGERIADGGGDWSIFFQNMYEVQWEVVHNHLHHEFTHNSEIVDLLQEKISLFETAKEEKDAAALLRPCRASLPSRRCARGTLRPCTVFAAVYSGALSLGHSRPHSRLTSAADQGTLLRTGKEDAPRRSNGWRRFRCPCLVHRDPRCV